MGQKKVRARTHQKFYLHVLNVAGGTKSYLSVGGTTVKMEIDTFVAMSLVLDVIRNGIRCRVCIHCALRASPKSSLIACHRLGYDIPLLVSKSTFPCIDRPLGVGIRSQGFCS